MFVHLSPIIFLQIQPREQHASSNEKIHIMVFGFSINHFGYIVKRNYFFSDFCMQQSGTFHAYLSNTLNIPSILCLNIIPHVREDNVTAFLCGKSVHLCNCIDMWWRVQEISRHSTKAPNFHTNQIGNMLFRTILHIFVKLSI